MKKSTKILLITGSVLLVAGVIVFAIAMCALDWNFKSLETAKFTENTHVLDDTFANISIDVDTADVKFIYTDGEECRVECFEEENAEHDVRVEGDTLYIEKNDTREWYERISIVTSSEVKICVYLPLDSYSSLSVETDTGDVSVPSSFEFKNVEIETDTGDVSYASGLTASLKIESDTGNVDVKNIESAASVDVSNDTGEVRLTNIVSNKINASSDTGNILITDATVKLLSAEDDTGDVVLTNVIGERFTVVTSTGDVRFDCSDAVEMFIETDTGDVKGTLLSEKVFIAQSDTGSIDVPKTLTGGRCEVTTNTGDIKLKLK